MAHLTNGTMSYERRVKTGDFEHKHAAVTISYALDEGDDADQLLALARTLVVQHVHQAVGIKMEPAKARPVLVAGNDVTNDHVAVDPVPNLDPVMDPGVVVPDELNRGFMVPESFTKPDEELLPRTTLQEALAEIVAPVTNLKAAKRAAKKRQPVEEHVIEDPTPAATSSSVLLSEPVVETSPVSSEIVDDFTAVAPAATDAELAQALSRVNAKLKDRPRIQALIGEFVQSGQHYYMIPAVRRAEFISKLEALI